ncbi:1-acyl-sn-glycerol-3-phosphate acyltransferase [Corynebacterium sp. TAE3-ERU12]|uniref:1-acyl-sn-glycerol-3-phosphate acyltransferase n=1 Tax=Corynebacterium sp. TAE3-ERU12 TaxID=2849491 RepID=UPI001C472F39|nr:1-acyl-sn-glycerol-3-phosphate acyltransferase [Corynebacterium sp. TAE3-ERU12]MBV7294540.1 1-acyl-sn-glycerol-3-phosphate acyltransferase [Corynebacterium sp. TAE3-ERU12]
MTEGLDMDFVESVWLPALAPLYDSWFRVDVTGTDNLPKGTAGLLVSNHSGNLPIDAFMVQTAVYRASGRWSRVLAGDVAWTMPGISDIARTIGAVRADPAAAHSLLRGGWLVSDFPEGYRGLGKPYSQRYELQRFGRGGFAALALRHDVPIVPVAITGAEEIYPQLGSLLRGPATIGNNAARTTGGQSEGAASFDEALADLVYGLTDMIGTGARGPISELPVFFLGAEGRKRREALTEMLADVARSAAKDLGIPYLPTTPFFPWLGPLGLVPLPSKWTIDFLEPVDARQWAAQYRAEIMEPVEAAEELTGEQLATDPVSVLGLADDVRGQIHNQLLSRLRTRRSAFY